MSAEGRVLVTGAGGFVGRHTLAPLQAAGFEVHAVSSRPPEQAREANPSPGVPVRWHQADLLAPGAGAALIEAVRPSHLLHLAWVTTPGIFWTSAENLAWVAASLALLRAFAQAGGRRVAIAGTCAEYEWGASVHCVEEDAGGGVNRRAAAPRPPTPLRPATLYGAAKHGLHVIAGAWARQAGLSLAWGRIFWVYGPFEHEQRLVAALARALLLGEQAACSHGRQVRDFSYAPELARAFVALLRSDVTGAVNMASGEPVPVAEAIDAVAAAAGRPELVRLGARPSPPQEPRRVSAEVTRLREEVGFTPAFGLREGIELTVAWWRERLGVQRGVRAS